MLSPAENLTPNASGFDAVHFWPDDEYAQELPDPSCAVAMVRDDTPIKASR